MAQIRQKGRGLSGGPNAVGRNVGLDRWLSAPRDSEPTRIGTHLLQEGPGRRLDDERIAGELARGCVQDRRAVAH